MDIIKALRKEEAKLEKQAKNAAQHLAAIRVAVKAFGGSLTTSTKATGRKERKLSAAGRAKISRAAKARWAKVRAAEAAKPRRKMSAAGRARIAKAQKARWAKVKAAKKKAA